MKMHDAIVLAYTKYRTRKLRSILVIFGSACITAIVLFFSIATAGLQRSVISKASPLAKMNLARVISYSLIGEYNTSSPEENLKNITSSLQIQDNQINDVYQEANLNQITSSELSELKSTNTSAEFFMSYIRTIVKDESLLKNYVQEGYSLDYEQGQPLPIIVSADFVEDRFVSELNAIKDLVERHDKAIELQKQFLGKKQTLTLTMMTETSSDVSVDRSAKDPETSTLTLDVQIVGFAPSSKGFLSGLMSQDGKSIQIGMNAAKEHPQLKDIKKQVDTYYISFKDKATRQKIVENSRNGSGVIAEIYGDAAGSVKDLSDTVSKVLKWVIIVMLLFVTLPMMSTMSKILADSQRETGVFRAIGARNRDIVQIYAVYSALLATVAFAMALLIASIIASILTLKYGALLGAQLSDITGSASITTVSLYGVNALHWAALYAILLGSSVLGTALPVSRTLRKDPIIAMRDE